MRRHTSVIAVMLLAVALLTTTIAGCTPAAPEPEAPSGAEESGATAAPDNKGETIVFADVSWAASTFMSNLAAYITDVGYGYTTEVVTAANVVALKSIETGDIDVHMDVEIRSIGEVYDEVVATGKAEALGVSYTPVWQGWLVPRYMIEGDAERGIEATMPDFKDVFDLEKYWQLFEDPEDSTKGRFLNCVPGWQCETTNSLKMQAYGLDKYFNVVSPGSDTVLSASMVSAFEKGEPWFGYYWAPSWVLGMTDMVKIPEPEFDEALWNEESKYACAYSVDDGNIVGATSLQQRAPEVREFLLKFNIPVNNMDELLLYLHESGKDASEVVPWFLTRYEDVWTEWVPADVAERVKAAS
ncbi:MAG: ABC transporter substrate-binding protein [Dehalococcoidia bacterium]|nr:MAG: ABC transporter substrate-binding protein [Dehalococcoidia bacterium]